VSSSISGKVSMEADLDREAACRTHGNEQNDAMNAFHNAAKSYKKTNPEGQLL
jgi:hypothetical protein